MNNEHSYVTRDIPINGTQSTSKVDPETKRAILNEAKHEIINIMSSRMEWIRHLSPDNRRNLEHDCGYPQMGEDYEPKQYRNLYERNPFASRVVKIWPREAWKVQPEIYDDENPSVESPFELAVKNLAKNLRPEKSYFKQEEGNVLWQRLKQAHIDSRIGRFGILLYGFDDGKNLSDPVTPTLGMRLLFLKSFSEESVTIKQLDSDKKSVRRGLPLMYSITFAKDDNPSVGDTKDVHWTRVLHICEGDEVYSDSKMKPVLNNLLNLNKIYGASGEGYWRSAFNLLAIETNPNIPNPKVNKGELKDMVEDLFNGLERSLYLTNASAKSISGSISDPGSHIDINVQAICVELATPKRIFLGSERGELASTQDDDNWNNRLVEYNSNYTTPGIVSPFFDRLIWAGVLPMPQNETYFCYWPDMAAQSESQKLDNSVKKIAVVTQYIQGGVSNLIPEPVFLSSFLFLDKKEIQEIQEGLMGEEFGEDDEEEGDEEEPLEETTSEDEAPQPAGVV